MNKFAFPLALLAFGVTASGCPIYESDQDGCYSDFDCADGYFCDDSSLTCVATSPGSPSCEKPSDCGTNETCGRSGICVSGDCHFSSVGCVRGFSCSSESGRWQCEASGSAAGGAPSGGAASDGGAAPSEGGGAASDSGAGNAGEPSTPAAGMSSGGAPAGAAGAGG